MFNDSGGGGGGFKGGFNGLAFRFKVMGFTLNPNPPA